MNLREFTTAIQQSADTEKKRIDAAITSRVVKLTLDLISDLGEEGDEIIRRRRQRRLKAIG